MAIEILSRDELLKFFDKPTKKGRSINHQLQEVLDASKEDIKYLLHTKKISYGVIAKNFNIAYQEKFDEVSITRKDPITKVDKTITKKPSFTAKHIENFASDEGFPIKKTNTADK